MEKDGFLVNKGTIFLIKETNFVDVPMQFFMWLHTLQLHYGTLMAKICYPQNLGFLSPQCLPVMFR
jgi:hypothetical protein